MKSPRLILVAGVNGAGKSTLTKRLTRLLGPDLGILLDPDAIARALAPDDPSRAAISAARIVLGTINRALENRERLIVETTLADRNRQIELLEQARKAGFKTWVFYLGLSDVARHLVRVQQRVLRGGHDVPDEDVIRRFTRSRANLVAVMRLADRTMVYDNSGQTSRVVASVERGVIRRSSGEGWWTPLLEQLEN